MMVSFLFWQFLLSLLNWLSQKDLLDHMLISDSNIYNYNVIFALIMLIINLGTIIIIFGQNYGNYMPCNYIPCNYCNKIRLIIITTNDYGLI